MIALKENNVSTLEAGKSRKRLSINVVSNVLGLAVRILITLWFTPYLISHLGVATYGLISLANSVTNYMSILTNGLNSAIGRFLTISLARADYRVANRTFNTALLGMVVLVVLLLPVVISFSWAVPYLFDVPSGLDNGVQQGQRRVRTDQHGNFYDPPADLHRRGGDQQLRPALLRRDLPVSGRVPTSGHRVWHGLRRDVCHLDRLAVELDVHLLHPAAGSAAARQGVGNGRR